MIASHLALGAGASTAVTPLVIVNPLTAAQQLHRGFTCSQNAIHRSYYTVTCELLSAP